MNVCPSTPNLKQTGNRKRDGQKKPQKIEL